MNIYLDVDGVLVGKGIQPANYAAEFIEYTLTNYPDSTYWLTTHCSGDTKNVLYHLGHIFDPKTMELLKMVKPTVWSGSKTKAIDFTIPFLWFDDNLFYEEKLTLIKHDALDNYIAVNLNKDPDQLLKFINSFPLSTDILDI